MNVRERAREIDEDLRKLAHCGTDGDMRQVYKQFYQLKETMIDEIERAINDALEEAAKLADNFEMALNKNDHVQIAAGHVKRGIAHGIRALKGEGKSD